MRITSEGRATIPLDTREKAGPMPNTDVDFEHDGQAVRPIPSEAPTDRGRGGRVVTRLRGKGDVAMTTDEIMALTRGEP